ncbi:ROK family protein [Agromyces marinus]|uniref:ROK family protein n=1 Tax=Agromyces marinus TaxID=1389020 RepID=A0ABN6YAD8_9MICO|nr:ROK family protein [Agromyces marinus]UIP57797.1 N-acetylmannosamine kinase [Agromyces marinus]BDZ54021.1 hypothetical protein GCM10025870_10940 [Agromyces marinus]
MTVAALRAGADHVVGIDLGGTKVRAGIARRAADAEPLAVIERATVPGGGRGLVDQLATLVRELAAVAGTGQPAVDGAPGARVADGAPGAPGTVAAIGIGGAGVPDTTAGGFDRAPNLGDLASFSLADELAFELACPVVIENDVNVAALGELAGGVGREHDCFAFVSVGTGIGMGLVLERRIVRGAGNAAGEIGYLPIGADPSEPSSHRRGALEEVVAGDALARRYGDAVTAREVFARAEAGDARALASIDEEAKWIAHAIAAVDAVVDPGRYVLGGGIGTRPELLGRIHPWLARLGRGGLPVTISELGDSAPVLGALRLAADAAPRPHEGVPA